MKILNILFALTLAALTIVTLIGLLPEARAGSPQCFEKGGRVVCCTGVAGFPYCN